MLDSQLMLDMQLKVLSFFALIKFADLQMFLQFYPSEWQVCATSSEKVSSNMRKMHRFRFIPRMRKVLFKQYSFVSNDSVCGQRMPWSDCADAQADLGLRCPYMPEDTFSHGAAHFRDTPIAPVNKTSRITCEQQCTEACDRVKDNQQLIFNWDKKRCVVSKPALPEYTSVIVDWLHSLVTKYSFL